MKLVLYLHSRVIQGATAHSSKCVVSNSTLQCSRVRRLEGVAYETVV